MKNGDKPINPLLDLNEDKSGLWGLTKREYFAGLAMQGLLMNFMQHGHYGNSVHDPMVAEMAIICADELLKQLDNEPKPNI